MSVRKNSIQCERSFAKQVFETWNSVGVVGEFLQDKLETLVKPTFDFILKVLLKKYQLLVLTI